MKEPNISNLREYVLTSNEIKNYKTLVAILEEPTKTGKAKILQMEDFARYFIHKKDKQKFIITEIFAESLTKIDHRKDIDKEGNNSKYVEHVKVLLLNILLQCENYTYTLTKNKWFELLGMVNKMYLDKDIAKMIISKNDDRIKDFEINHFYFRTNGQLTRILFDSFNSLKRKCLIKYREVNIIVRLNEKLQEVHTESTKAEELLILDAQYTALADMELDSIMQVVLKFKTEEYQNRVNKKLQESNIKYFYKQLELIFNKDNVLRELSSLDVIKQHKQELNDKILDIINHNARKTYQKNQEEYDLKLDDFLYNDNHIGHCKPETSFKMFLHKDEYLDLQMIIADYLIKLN